MNELVAGIDLCDEYTQVNCNDEEKTWTFPTVLCRHKVSGTWSVGEDAYAQTLRGEGSLTDKLVKLVLKDGTATLDGVRYPAKELLELFLERVLRTVKKDLETEDAFQGLVFTVRSLDERLVETLYSCGEKLGLEKKQIRVIGHTESMIYYMLSQKKEIWSGTVGMFDLSEQELDRIEILVQNLLKITKLDAGAIVLEKTTENVADMMRDIELHFAYRARQEKKEIILSGSDHLSLFCDRDWLNEAIDNIVKNAFDHTESGATIRVAWKELPSGVQIVIKDNGCGIHPEDIHHIFKRFYRSRFSKDKQGIGLGLPLAKAIVEAHNGTIEVDSELGIGTTFTMNFLIPTKL